MVIALAPRENGIDLAVERVYDKANGCFLASSLYIVTGGRQSILDHHAAGVAGVFELLPCLGKTELVSQVIEQVVGGYDVGITIALDDVFHRLGGIGELFGAVHSGISITGDFLRSQVSGCDNPLCLLSGRFDPTLCLFQRISGLEIRLFDCAPGRLLGF
ncbi:hypothetical protein D9M68_659410 [compost metagenome]